jgi:hypothetical protein
MVSQSCSAHECHQPFIFAEVYVSYVAMAVEADISFGERGMRSKKDEIVVAL